MSDTAIADYALLSDRHSAALVSRDGSVDWLCCPALRQPVDLRSAAGRAGGPLVGAGVGRRRGHPSLRGSHHGVGDDVPHGHRDRGRRRRVGDGGGQPRARPRAGTRRISCCGRSRAPRRGRDRGGVRPSTRVRPGAPVARRGRRGTGRDRWGRCPRPVVPGAVGRRRVVRLGPVAPACRESGSASPCITTSGPTRGRPGCGASPRSRRGWTTRCRRGSRGRSCTRRTSVRGTTSSTTADGCSRRCRSNPPARSAPRPPPRCPRSSAAPATGTTATPGSGTPRSPSRRCGWRPAPMRPTSSSTT